MDRIFAHTITRECSGGIRESPRVSLPTLLRSLGFAIASELYYQPSDEAQYKKAVASKATRFAVPTLCSHRTFITFGDAFTTCPEDPSRCHGLVNQNRWHSYLCSTNRENPGEMPSKMPEALIMRKVGGENLVDMLLSRYRINEQKRKTTHPFTDSSSQSSANASVLVPASNPLSSEPLRQKNIMSTCHIARRQSGALNSMLNSQQIQATRSGGEMSTLRQTLNNTPMPLPQNQSCVVCDIVPPKGPCFATTFPVDYMISVPLVPITAKEQWSNYICRSLPESVAQRLLNAFRITHLPRLCIRHFHPCSLSIGRSGAIIKNPASIGELPLLDFLEFATLNAEFSQAFNKLIDSLDKGQNSTTISMMLKIVQDLVKCNDEKCGRPLSSCKDVLFHRFHGLQHKFVCMECFSTKEFIRTEQEMIEHFVSKHGQRNRKYTRNFVS
ncbi:unnamed protein product [Strongylus vulgaris]|uniref:Uncharacterized protein n=1 Tax=Strongylus vulgaris TaxID=40348 RepID=A0A3P7KBY7_STRVU|nr:unnamed protein product [Strongylus vulgaris]